MSGSIVGAKRSAGSSAAEAEAEADTVGTNSGGQRVGSVSGINDIIRDRGSGTAVFTITAETVAAATTTTRSVLKRKSLNT